MQDAAKAAAVKRSSSGTKPATKSSGSSRISENYYSGDSGIKVQPKTVLIISLVYMGIVLLLHIFGKLRGVPSAANTDTPPN